MLADVIINDNNPGHGTLPQKVANGDVYLITIISQNNTGSPPSLTDLQDQVFRPSEPIGSSSGRYCTTSDYRHPLCWERFPDCLGRF